MIIEVYVKGREKPFYIEEGKYLGHKRPDRTITDNWHYYEDIWGNFFHFRKNEMQAVICRKEPHDEKE